MVGGMLCKSDKPSIIIIIKVVVDGRNKNRSGLFHFLSGARAAPGVGQLGKADYLSSIFEQHFSRKLLWYLTPFKTFFGIFLKYKDTLVIHKNLKILTEHKPEWNSCN